MDRDENLMQVTSMRDLLIHDIRSPLAAISGYAQLLRRRAAANAVDGASVADGLQHIENAALRVARLLDELADLAVQAETDDGAGRRQAADLVLIARRMAAESQAVSSRPPKSSVVVLAAVPQLHGWWDVPRLERMLANLIGNALKYSHQDDVVVVTLQQTDGWAVIAVADQGVGIPAAELPRVFELGYRASNVASVFQGTGLGLAGVHEIVTQHGGTIAIDSQLGHGTTVTVRLPLQEGDR
ncbi:MAG TPA: HAMP domain-containing sensor histidine kinase [Chloroflexota bacterium]|nr:HAMP domain-containing sensor histidine kinase [Chloroflexota bacterium]